MKVTWITGRKIFSDLAGTTELGIMESLSLLGDEITIVSPDDIKIKSVNRHLLISRLRIKGLETISGSINIKKIINKNPEILKNADIIFVDWRFVGSLNNLITKYSIPYCIIDRGPPVYDGFIAKLQKLFWRRNWLIASKGESCIGGFVVSGAHKKYVYDNIVSDFKIEILPAGTNTNLFSGLNNFPVSDLKIVYAGRIDSNRGMENILNFRKNLHLLNISATITIIGEGDYKDKFIKTASKFDDLIFLGKKNREEVWKILDESNVGIMPMPDRLIWNIASPIKLAEYAAAGLLIIGYDHAGNKLGDYEYSLLSKDKWEFEAIDLLNGVLDEKSWEKLTFESRKSSLEYDWEKVAKKIHLVLNKWLN